MNSVVSHAAAVTQETQARSVVGVQGWVANWSPHDRQGTHASATLWLEKVLLAVQAAQTRSEVVVGGTEVAVPDTHVDTARQKLLVQPLLTRYCPALHSLAR